MRIIIKEPNSKKGIRLILPYHLAINLAVRKTWFKMAIKSRCRTQEDSKENSGTPIAISHSEEVAMRYLNALDFGEIRAAMHDLSLKSGVVLVEVESSDGTYIQIVT